MNEIYIYYIEKFGGEIENNLFFSLLNRAMMKLNQNINRNVELEDIELLGNIDKLKVYYVICSMIENINNNYKNDYQSLSLDGISYSKKTTNEIEKELRNIYNLLPQEWIKYV